MPRGIAIDWVAGNVYWTDSGRDVIEVAQMKGENRKTLISGMIDEPHAIVVDPLRGWAGVLGEASGRGGCPASPGVPFPSQASLRPESSSCPRVFRAAPSPGPPRTPGRPREGSDLHLADCHGQPSSGLLCSRSSSAHLDDSGSITVLEEKIYIY